MFCSYANTQQDCHEKFIRNRQGPKPGYGLCYFAVISKHPVVQPRTYETPLLDRVARIGLSQQEQTESYVFKALRRATAALSPRRAKAD